MVFFTSMVHRRRGIGMLETVIACILFSMISIALVSLWYSHYRLLATTQHRTVANYVCKQIMEEQLSKPYVDVKPFSRAANPPIIVESIFNDSKRTAEFQYACSVIDMGTHKDLKVTVWWKEDSIEHDFHLETIVLVPF